jgi:hypothetical protein
MSATIYWTASTDSDIDSYDIQRSAAQAGPFTSVASVDHDYAGPNYENGRCFYVDSGGNAASWYQVRAVDSIGQTSAWSTAFQAQAESAMVRVLITGKVLLPDGTAPRSGTVEARLSQPGTAMDGTKSERVASIVRGNLESDGTMPEGFRLVPNDVISPAGTAYKMRFSVVLADGSHPPPWTENWQVSSDTDPIDVGAILRVGTTGTQFLQAPGNMGGDASAAIVTATGSPRARSLAERASDLVNVRDFLPLGQPDGTTDNANAIAAALAAGAGGSVYFPAGTYISGAPLRLQDSTAIVGAGRTATRIIAPATFSGDALFSAYRRDDNNANTWDQFTIQDISLYVPASPDITGIDLTGTRNASVFRVNAYGPGLTSGTAMRLSDENPAGTSIKSTFFSSVRDFNGDGSQWKLFLYLEQKHSNCSNWEFNGMSSYSTNAVRFNYATGGAVGRFTHWYAAGPGGNNFAVGTVPSFITFDQVSIDILTNNLRWAANQSISTDQLATYRLNLQYLTWNNASSRTAPATAGTSLGAQAFDGAGYIKIPSGSTIAAGSNTFQWYSNAPLGSQPSILIVPVAGLPTVPLTFGYGWSSAGGYPFVLYVVSQAAFTLPADLILWIGWVDNGGGSLAANAPTAPAAVTLQAHSIQYGSAGPTMSYGAAAPSSGTWVLGSVVKNSSPSVGQPKGWICTVAGTPGTWVSEGNL